MTRADIRRLIEPFYKRVRADPRLGPIFEGRIGVTDAEWAEHLDTIEAFWSNVMLRERAYRGNPMAAHLSVPEIRGEDFEIWLDLFEETARETLPEEKADAFAILSRRIGASLRMGLEQARGGVVPRLRRA